MREFPVGHTIYISREKGGESCVRPVYTVKFCTGVVLPLPALLLAAGGVAGVVVLSLPTRLLPEDSLQQLCLTFQQQNKEEKTHISTNVGLGVGIVALGVIVSHDLIINLLITAQPPVTPGVDSKKTNRLDLALYFLIVCLSPRYLQRGFTNILSKQAFNPQNSNREKDLNIGWL